jgi:hypothetical protein
LVRQFLRAQERSIAIDTHGEYGGVSITNPHDLAAYLNARGSLPFRIAYQDKGWHEIPMPQVFGMLKNCRGTWIAFEEASQWTEEPNLQWFVQYGRHNDISCLFVARRPKDELDVLTRANADVIVSFQQQEPADLEWIRQIGGEDARDRIAALSWENHEWDYVLAQHDGIVETLDSLAVEVASESGSVATGTDGFAGDRVPGPVVADSEAGEEHTSIGDRPEGARRAGDVPGGGEGPAIGQARSSQGTGEQVRDPARSGRTRGGRRGRYTYAERVKQERLRRQALAGSER